jgi:divalent metal cation (Fe/Co/Zn/Cd) transporter
MPELDGVASILIGGVLAVTAVLLARETKGLLVGEAAVPQVHASILRTAMGDEGIRAANGVITSQIGPHQVLVSLSAEFEDKLTTEEIEACVCRVEAAIMAAHPEVVMLFVKPQTAEVWQAKMKRRAEAVRAHEEA